VISVSRRLLARAAAVLLLPASAAAQAFTPPPRVGSVTVAWQWVDNTGHILTDGTFLPIGQSVTTSLLAEVDYGVTERFAATASVPFIFARYTGGLPPFSGLERDSCRCWHESFQDFSIAGRYRFGDEFWALTPQVRYIQPTHDYPYHGEAVVGPNLQQLVMGISAAWRLAHVLPKAGLQGGYSFTLAEPAVEGIRPNRSNVAASLGYALTRSLYVQGGALFQKNHGGLTIFDMAGAPPEQNAQADRLLKMRFWHVTGGVSYSTRFADLFVAIEPYIWGRDTHDGIAYTAGSTWYFDFSKRKP
jgi:hypothetical protein